MYLKVKFKSKGIKSNFVIGMMRYRHISATLIILILQIKEKGFCKEETFIDIISQGKCNFSFSF